jgi:hypothetical protein
VVEYHFGVGPPISALFDAVDINPLTLAVRAPCSNCRASTASQGILLDGIVVFDGYGMVSRRRTPDRQRCAVLYELSLFKSISTLSFHVVGCANSSVPPSPEETIRYAGGWMQEMERVGYRNRFLPLIRAPEERLPPRGVWPPALAWVATLPDVLFLIRSKSNWGRLKIQMVRQRPNVNVVIFSAEAAWRNACMTTRSCLCLDTQVSID